MKITMLYSVFVLFATMIIGIFYDKLNISFETAKNIAFILFISMWMVMSLSLLKSSKKW